MVIGQPLDKCSFCKGAGFTGEGWVRDGPKMVCWRCNGAGGFKKIHLWFKTISIVFSIIGIISVLFALILSWFGY